MCQRALELGNDKAMQQREGKRRGRKDDIHPANYVVQCAYVPFHASPGVICVPLHTATASMGEAETLPSLSFRGHLSDNQVTTPSDPPPYPYLQSTDAQVLWFRHQAKQHTVCSSTLVHIKHGYTPVFDTHQPCCL